MEGQAVLAEAEDSTAVAADADSFSLHVRKKTGATFAAAFAAKVGSNPSHPLCSCLCPCSCL
jgi:hypothetical protein